MENNSNYEVEDTEKGKTITFEKGCVIDYEYLWNTVLMDNLLSNEHVHAVHGRDVDSVRFSEKVKIEIKPITRRKKLWKKNGVEV